MYFTQEDYKKIENWLSKKAVKDSDFQEALPLNGEEIITVVQSGQNKKVNIREFIDKIYKYDGSDFTNITNTYKVENITLEEAINFIPIVNRKKGQVITFLNTDGNWEIYQFIGELNQWNVLDAWKDLFDREKLIINSILPDEEDLTKSLPDENGNSYLSLKDRAYNPEDFSGLGRIILRKNIVEVEDPIYGKVKKNVLYQDMINKENTIYVIRYDFILVGDITIPENCVLEFDGGSISGQHTLTGANTGINAGLVKILGTDITLAGSWNVVEAYPEWFGAKGDGITDDRLAIDRTFAYFDNISFAAKTYKIICVESTVFAIDKSISIHGVFEATVIQFTNTNENTICFLLNRDLIKIENIILKGIEGETKGIGIKHQNNHRNPSYGRSLHLTNVKVWYFHDGIIANSYLNTFRWVECAHCVNGFYIGTENTLDMTTNTLICCFARSCSGIGYKIIRLIYSSLINCAADLCSVAYDLQASENLTLLSCGCESCEKAFNIRSSSNIGIHNQRIYNPNAIEKSVYNKLIDVATCSEITFFSLQRSVNETNKSHKYITVGNSMYPFVPCVRFTYCNDYDLNILEAVVSTGAYPNNIEFVGCGKTVINDNSRPNAIYAALGTQLFDRAQKRPIYWSENGWYDAAGYKAVINKGATRPTGLTANDNGLDFFDTNLKKHLSWDNNYGFVEYDGILAGVKRSGTTSERPNSTSLYIGFQYFDTTLSKPIYVSAINGSVVTWVDATGTQV